MVATTQVRQPTGAAVALQERLLRLSYCRRKADNNKGSHCKAESKSSRRSFHAAHVRTGVGVDQLAFMPIKLTTN